MASRSIAIKITVDKTTSVQDVQLVTSALKGLELQQQKVSQLQEGLTNSFIKGNLAARAISVGYNIVKDSFVAVTKSAADLEFTMAKIQAISGESSVSVGALSNDVNNLALASSKSAVDIAKAALEMNKIGLSNPQVRLLLGSVVALSTALDEDLVKSGETVVNILNAYGDSVLDGKKRTEELAFTVGASALTMESFGTAFAYVGATAKLAGVKFEDLTAAMDVLSNSGIRASTIGTQLRRIIAELSDENSKGAKAIGGTIESLGGLIPAMEKLREVTPKGDAGVAFLTEKFGRQATSVAAILATNTEELKRLSAATEDSTGSLSRMQDTMNETFLAKWQHFTNIIKTLGGGPLFVLKSGLDLVNETLDSMGTGLSKVVKGFDAFLRAADTKKSVAKGGGFGDLLVGDQKAVNEQIKALDALKKKSSEMAGPDDFISDKAKKTKSFSKTYRPEFDPMDVFDRLGDIQSNGDSYQENFQAKLAKEKLAAKAEEAKMRASMAKIIADKDKYAPEAYDGKDKDKKLEKLAAEQQAELAQFTKFQGDLTEVKKAQEKERHDYAIMLAQQELQMKLQVGASFVAGMGALFAQLAKKNRDLAVVAKGIAIAEVGMNTAVAVSKVWGQTGIFGVAAQAAPILSGAAQIMAINAQKFASGTDQIVNKPTMFMAGESGKERVQVTPRAKMGSGSGASIVVNIHGDVMDGAKFTEAVEMAQKKLNKRNV